MTIHYDEMSEAIGQNFYLSDPNLAFMMDRFVAAEDRAFAEEKLAHMGALIGGPIAQNAELTDKDPARLVRWNREGDEINQVRHPASVLETKRLLWQNDFLHLPYSEEAQKRGRPVPPALMLGYSYLLSQAETGMLCSVGMTSGVLRLIERYGNDETRAMFVPRLKTNDYDRGWDGSMYLTERAGGSDLGATETTARLVDGEWKLDGFKWFCSNVDGAAIVTLARPEGAPAGIKGLALFAVPRRFPDGRENGIHIRRIKEKLGTRAVPTGEIDLVGATGYLLAGSAEATDGRGINRMMEFVNESRLGVAAMGAGIMRRVLLEAVIRAHRRQAFGQRLIDFPMVRETLLDLMVESEAASSMLFRVASRLTGPGEAIGEGDKLPRILVPLVKQRCTRGGIESASAALEVFGGNGYIEDWPMARQLRDAQCHTIWEGTDNVLSLDVLRSMHKENTLSALTDLVYQCVTGATHPMLSSLKQSVAGHQSRLTDRLSTLAGAPRERALLHAKKLCHALSDITQAALLLDDAQFELSRSGGARKALVAAWFIRRRLEPGGAWHTGNEGIALELAEPLLRYENIAAERAAEIARL